METDPRVSLRRDGVLRSTPSFRLTEAPLSDSDKLTVCYPSIHPQRYSSAKDRSTQPQMELGERRVNFGLHLIVLGVLLVVRRISCIHLRSPSDAVRTKIWCGCLCDRFFQG